MPNERQQKQQRKKKKKKKKEKLNTKHTKGATPLHHHNIGNLQVFTYEMKNTHVNSAFPPSRALFFSLPLSLHLHIVVDSLIFRNRNTNAREKWCLKRSSDDWLYATHELKQLKYNVNTY